MASDDDAETRLREILHDPRWSLLPRPDAPQRIRRAARRQRIRAGGGVAVVAVIVAAAIAVPLSLLGGGGAARGIAPASSASPSRHAEPHPAFTLPPVGATGFPVSIYPPPPSSKELNLVGQCPSASGLQQPGPGTAAAALRVVQDLGRSFQSDLRLSDRVYWPQVLANWKAGTGTASGPVNVLYSGPLESYHQAFGPPDMASTILSGCGSQVAGDTWMIVTGKKNLPGLQGEFLMLDRRGHMLLWNAQ